MKPSILFGLLFAAITMVQNIVLATKISEKSIGIILISGLLFFNILFTLLFTKRKNQFNLPFHLGFKSAVQTGMLQGLGYFLSIFIIRKWIAPQLFPDLDTFSQYMMIFNLNIILFAVGSALIGAIATALLFTKSPTQN